MKKTKRDGLQASEPPSSSSSSSQLTGATLSQGHSQPEWEEPLDFTTQSGVKEEDREEVLEWFIWRTLPQMSISDYSYQIINRHLQGSNSIWTHKHYTFIYVYMSKHCVYVGNSKNLLH